MQRARSVVIPCPSTLWRTLNVLAKSAPISTTPSWPWLNSSDILNTMKTFNKDLFKKDGQYLLYGPDNRFVARFKHGGPFTMSRFRKELIASHTPESYFREYDRGVAPLNILKEANPGWYDGIMTAFKLGTL